MNDNGVSISLLVHSLHQKSMSFILYKSFTRILFYSTEIKRKKPLRGGRTECSLRRRRWNATHSHEVWFLFSKTCNLQSNDAIIDPKCFGTTSVIGVKAKPRKQFGRWSKFFWNKLGITFRETEKSMDQGCHWCKDRRVFSRAVGVERVWEAGASGLDYTDW